MVSWSRAGVPSAPARTVPSAPARPVCAHGTPINSTQYCQQCLMDFQKGETRAEVGESRTGDRSGAPKMCAISGEVTYSDRCGTCGSPAVPIGTPRTGVVSAGPATDYSGAHHDIPETQLGNPQTLLYGVDEIGGHDEMTGTHAHVHLSHAGPDADRDGFHSHLHEHVGNAGHDHPHPAGLQESVISDAMNAGGVPATPVSSSGRWPDTSPAGRQAYLNSAEYLGKDGTQLPAMPRGLNFGQQIDWADQMVLAVTQEENATWHTLCDVRETAVPTPAGRAMVGELERLHVRQRAKLAAAERLAHGLHAQFDRELVRVR